MSESLFTSQTPAGQFSDGAPGLTLATLFTPAVDGTVTGIRWYFPSILPAGTVTAQLYSRTDDSSGTLLASGTFTSPTGGAWNTAALTSTPVTAGSYYYATIWTPDRYVVTTNFFLSALVNGNLTAPASDNGIPRRNGRFAAGASPTYPTTSSNEPCYFVDVVFTAGGGATVDGAASLSAAGALAATALLIVKAAAALSATATLTASTGGPIRAGSTSAVTASRTSTASVTSVTSTSTVQGG